MRIEEYHIYHYTHCRKPVFECPQCSKTAQEIDRLYRIRHGRRAGDIK